MPVIDDIFPELYKARVFTKANQDGFIQVQMDEAKSKLMTFQTAWGRYRWLRMPYGISPAQACFQLDQCLDGLQGVYKVADVLLIIDQEDTDEEADQDHDHNFKSLLDKCRTQGIKLNKDKFR